MAPITAGQCRHDAVPGDASLERDPELVLAPAPEDECALLVGDGAQLFDKPCLADARFALKPHIDRPGVDIAGWVETAKVKRSHKYIALLLSIPAQCKPRRFINRLVDGELNAARTFHTGETSHHLTVLNELDNTHIVTGGVKMN